MCASLISGPGCLCRVDCVASTEGRRLQHSCLSSTFCWPHLHGYFLDCERVESNQALDPGSGRCRVPFLPNLLRRRALCPILHQGVLWWQNGSKSKCLIGIVTSLPSSCWFAAGRWTTSCGSCFARAQVGPCMKRASVSEQWSGVFVSSCLRRTLPSLVRQNAGVHCFPQQ